MKWRKYPDEKPTKNAYDKSVYVFACDCTEKEIDFLGQIKYNPDYDMFFRAEVKCHYGSVYVTEKPIEETVTHFAFEDDVILPKGE